MTIYNYPTDHHTLSVNEQRDYDLTAIWFARKWCNSPIINNQSIINMVFYDRDLLLSFCRDLEVKGARYLDYVKVRTNSLMIRKCERNTLSLPLFDIL